MVKPWEICVLVHEYLKKNTYSKTLTVFNDECSYLNIPDPPPSIFTCVVEDLVSKGDLEARLQHSQDLNDSTGSKKLNDLEREIKHIRKRLKKRKRHYSGTSDGSKKQRRLANSTYNTSVYSQQDPSHLACSLVTAPSLINTSSVPYPSQMIPPLSSSVLSVINSPSGGSLSLQMIPSSSVQPDYTHSSDYTQPMVGPQSQSRVTLPDEAVFMSPEKRFSSSRRKIATPKKLTSSIEGSFIQKLTNSINEKNEEAALDTLNSAEPWLDQFLSEISGTVPVNSVSESPNEEAALSLLALNQSSEQLHAGNVLSVSSPPCTASQGDASCNLLTEAIRPLHSVAQNEPSKSGSDPSGFNSPVNCAPAVGQPNETDRQGMIFDPIVIKNKKSIKLAQNNPNIEIIVLPPIHTQYQHILPKPTAESPSQCTAIPTGSESFTFVKPSPQQVAEIEAQKFFEPMKRPYHQQLKMADQLYLIDASPKESPSRVPGSPNSKSKPKPDPVQPGEEEKEEDVKSECFLSWDQKIRQSMVTEFKPPEPPGKKKKEKVRKPSKSTKPRRKSEIMDFSNLTEGEIQEYLDKADEDGKRQYKKWVHRRKKVEKGPSKNKSKKKKRKKKEESREKIPITPEFVDESSEEDSGKTRNRHFSESDSLMADTLLKTLLIAGSVSRAAGEEVQASTPNVSVNPLAPPDFNETPVVLTEGTRPIRFMEENANSSFDILDSSRPKPVVIPGSSANSCSCHSVHQRETGKCASGRSSFSFKDQEGADSPRYYNENSNSVTVSSLFPSLSSSPASRGAPHPAPRIRDTNYRSPVRSPVQEEESEATEEEEEEVREQTSTLPPLESQERDLLESSDEESREETRSETKQKSLLKPAKRISQISNLSESDMDSPIKNPKLKQPLLLITKQRSPLLSTSGESCEDRKRSDPLHQPRRSSRVRNLSATAGTLTSSDSDQSLPSMHMNSDCNDSQELVIDGEEVGTCPHDTCHGDTGAVETVVTEDEGGVVGEKQRPQLARLVEDSCDSWYANIPNKMNTSFTCHLCKKKFPSLAVLSVHADNCTKMFLICSNCGKKCSSKSGLTLHKKYCLNGDTSTTPTKVNGKDRSVSQPKSKGKDTPTGQLRLKGKDTPASQPRFRGKEASVVQSKLKGKDKRKSSSENSKIKISPTKPSKKVKKRKVTTGLKVGNKEIDNFLENLRYDPPI